MRSENVVYLIDVATPNYWPAASQRAVTQDDSKIVPPTFHQRFLFHSFGENLEGKSGRILHVIPCHSGITSTKTFKAMRPQAFIQSENLRSGAHNKKTLLMRLVVTCTYSCDSPVMTTQL